jgi:2-desacetyl-2-hydroxyethyl bacteriochlorophyllide A dehydrogenase
MSETSVIIRAFNEERHLPALFDALDSQTYTDFETVVVDSGSFDRTREIAAARGDKLVRIDKRDFTFGHSLNVGIREGGGRFIAIISAHAIPTDALWLERLVTPLHDSDVAMAYGRQIGVPESKFSESRDFERTFGDERKVLVPPHFFAHNANSALRRALWREHRFDEEFPGLEDIEWAKYWMQRGYRVVYEPEAAIHHIHNETWAQVRRRYYREGLAANLLGLRRRVDVPGEVMREVRSCLGDLFQALQHRQLERGFEIVRFRFEKAAGSVQGIMEGTPVESSAARENLFCDLTYKAVVVRGPGKASLVNVECGDLKPSEVLVRVAYQGVCATDLEILSGELGYYKTGLAKYPIVPGHEFSGRVAARGENVTGLREGDCVVVECIQSCRECAACRAGNPIGCAHRSEVGVVGRDGGYAQYMKTGAEFVHRLPFSLPLKTACLCEPLAVVLKGLRRLARAWGDRNAPRIFAVVGAGPIGHLVARVLANRGHAVTVFDRNPQRLAYFEGSPIETGSDLSNLSAFDSIVEATGDAEALNQILHNSAPGCTVLLLGLPYARREFNFESIVGYDKMIVGSVGSNPEDFQEAVEILGDLDVASLTESVLPLGDFEQAWALSRAGKHLKVILDVEGAALTGALSETRSVAVTGV